MRTTFRGRRSAALAIGMTAVLIGLAGCGSDSSDSASTAAGGDAAAATTSGTAAKEVTGTPIVIGTICSCSGAVSSSSAAVPATLTAWAKWTNTHGGINGSPVKIVQLDDALDAATTVKQAKQLVEQDKVVAIVGEVSNLDGLWADYVKEKGIPVIGAAVFNTPYESNPVFFPTGAQNPTQVYGAIDQAKKAGKSKIGLMYCAEAPSCATYSALFTAIGKFTGGVSVVLNQKITADAPNYTAPCLAAKQAGVDALVILHAPAIVTRVTNSCAQQGFKPSQFNLSFTPGVDWAENPNMQGLVTITPNQSLWDTSIAPTKEFSDALDQFAPGIRDRPEYNPADSSAWAAGQVFKLAAERGKVGPDSTPADVLTGLYTFKDETLDGLTAPLTYAKGSPPPLVSCYFISAIKDQKWTAPQGAEPSCIPAGDVDKVKALLTKG